MIYLIGSLRNPEIPKLANRLRGHGYDVFDDWFAAGPEADDYWQRYEQTRGRSYESALKGLAAENVYRFDYKHLVRAHVVVLVMSAGKSGHLEFGWACGQGKPSYILFDKEPERWDVMYQFATGVYFSEQALLEALSQED